MTKLKLLAILMLVFSINAFSQTIKLLSDQDSKPLSNVIVFNEALEEQNNKAK